MISFYSIFFYYYKMDNLYDIIDVTLIIDVVRAKCEEGYK